MARKPGKKQQEETKPESAEPKTPEQKKFVEVRRQAERDELVQLMGKAVSSLSSAFAQMLKFIVAVNAGGAIATIGFIGASSNLGQRDWAAVVSLCCFAGGLAWSGITLYLSVNRQYRNAKDVRIWIAQWEKNCLSIGEIKKRAEAYEPVHVGWHFISPFVLFATGFGFGAYAAWPIW